MHFVNGNKEGYGILVEENGTRYEGTFKNNEKDGDFVVKNKDGKIIYKCKYKDGIMINKEEMQ